MTAPAVSMHNITRRFGSVVANQDVSLALTPGEIHALVGENGAGKTTLMRILYGLLEPDAGHIELGGRAVRIRRPADAIARGLGMVHQHFMLVETMTVAENITLGREPRGPAGAFRRTIAEREVAELADRYGLPADPRARIGDLSVGSQQRVEILKALYHGAQVLILDEPTAVLTPQEVEDLFKVLRALQARGETVVIITHKLAEVRAIADRVTVMRQGRVVGGGEIASLSTDAIAELMVGHPIAPLHERAQRPASVPLLEVHALEVRDDRGLDAVRRISFTVHGGEIVGIAGVEGNGQHELLEALAGLRVPQRGQIVINGRVCDGRSARRHFEAGLAHIPSDRLRRGLVLEMSLAENLVLGLPAASVPGRGFWMDIKQLETNGARLLERYSVRPNDPTARASQLSGGNQQRLIAARELSRGAPLLIAAHPTRGMDFSGATFLHQRLLDERDAGRAVLLVSSDLSEILSLSDRVLVLYEGRIVHEARPAETDERRLGLHMTGRWGQATEGLP